MTKQDVCEFVWQSDDPVHHYCKHCGKGWRPRCDELRLSDGVLTPAADEIAALARVLGSFADGDDRVLWKMAGVRLSESTVERTTEAAGRRVREQLGGVKRLGPPRAWAWQRDACGRCCAYVSRDATGVRQQSAGGHHADDWTAYVGMIHNPRSEYDPQRPSLR